jgi:transcription elongation factor Elf1
MAPHALKEPPRPRMSVTCPKCGKDAAIIGELHLGSTYQYFNCSHCRHAGDTRPRLK